jgi:hypothetical protein
MGSDGTTPAKWRCLYIYTRHSLIVERLLYYYKEWEQALGTKARVLIPILYRFLIGVN